METFFSVSRFFFKGENENTKKTQLGWLYIETPGPLDPPSIIPPGKKNNPPTLKKTLYGIHRFITFTTSTHTQK